MKMRTPALSLSVALLSTFAAFAAAGCAIGVEADVPDVQVTQRGVVFPGVAGGSVAGDMSMAKSYSQEHKKIEFPDGLDSDVRTLSVSLRATGGVGDLSFIHYMRITMAPDDGSAAIELGVYEPAPGAIVGDEIKLTTLNPINVFTAWNTDRAKFTLEVVGALPEHDWTGDVTAHFSGKLKYTY
jgi:hypothetical protein